MHFCHVFLQLESSFELDTDVFGKEKIPSGCLCRITATVVTTVPCRCVLLTTGDKCIT